MNTPELNFYTRPFKLQKHTDWVYDAKGNFVFQFEEYISSKTQNDIILSLNSIELEPCITKEIKVKNNVDLYINDNHIITIRGWGNLTGIGSHNFTAEKASKIQNDFVKYFIYKITSNIYNID